jgi:ATP-dependent Lhr-like helicase
VDALFDTDMMGDDLEAWMAESSMLRRTFRNVAVIAGLVDRHQPGADKNRRQVTVNTDLIYNVLRRHQPDHILLRATAADAAGGLTDLGRLSAMLNRVQNHIRVRRLDRVSPLAVPVLLDIGRESVRTEADEDALLLETEALVAEATAKTSVPRVLRATQARLEKDRKAGAAGRPPRPPSLLKKRV